MRRFAHIVVAVGLAMLSTAGRAIDRRPADVTASPGQPPLSITAKDRVLVLAPHPDDEVIACGGVLQQARAAGAEVRVVFLTYGDNNEWSFAVYRKHPVILPAGVRAMGEVRRTEAVHAAEELGIATTNLVFLGYPDFGTLRIWTRHWGAEPPYRNWLAHSSAVPYADAFRPGAAYKGEEVVADLTAILRAFRPTQIFVSHPADHNADHLALYLFTQVALWNVAPELQPNLRPFLVHFPGWPRPRGLQESLPALPPPALTGAVQWVALPLDQTAEARKRAALLRHKTQMEYSRAYLQSFVRTTEIFGDFSPIRITPDADPTQLETGHVPAASAESHPELGDEERKAYVAIANRSFALTNGQLEIRVAYRSPLAPAASLSVYAFGYRHDRPFGAMPKLHVEVGPFTEKIYDQSHGVRREDVTVLRHAHEVTLRIPLAILGDPERILTSAQTHAHDVPLDWVSWRVLEIAPPRRPSP